MKLSLAANLVLNWVFPVLAFPECLQPITAAAALCTVAINVLVPRAFNPKTQYFISLFNKISWLWRQQRGGDEPSNEGYSSGPTGHYFTDTLFSSILQGLEPIPETTTWKQLNPTKNLFSCDFNKNATRPCSWPFYRWLLAIQSTVQDSTNDRKTIDDSSSYVKTLKSPDQFS